VSHSQRARTAPRRTPNRRLGLAGLLIVIAAIPAALGHRSAPSAGEASRTEHRGAPGSSPHPRSGRRGPVGEGDGAVLRGDRGASLGEADGALPGGTTVFDDGIPGVARLDPALLSALRQAATDAAHRGVEFVVDSGWRSPAYQAQLLRDAVSKYGSEAEAARSVAPPDKSAHVTGDAVDLAPAASSWLSEHGAGYGLCRIYGNEPWHFELRPDAVAHGCPAVYADPTHDPRMQRP
jgi:hypothetical protein